MKIKNSVVLKRQRDGVRKSHAGEKQYRIYHLKINGHLVERIYEDSTLYPRGDKFMQEVEARGEYWAKILKCNCKFKTVRDCSPITLPIA